MLVPGPPHVTPDQLNQSLMTVDLRHQYFVTSPGDSSVLPASGVATVENDQEPSSSLLAACVREALPVVSSSGCVLAQL